MTRASASGALEFPAPLLPRTFLMLGWSTVSLRTATSPPPCPTPSARAGHGVAAGDLLTAGAPARDDLDPEALAFLMSFVLIFIFSARFSMP